MPCAAIRLSTPSPDMGPLDAMEWAEGFAFESHDVRVGIRVTDASIWPRLVERLPPDATPIPPVADHLFSIVGGEDTPSRVLYDGADPILDSTDLETLVDTTESRVRLHVATWSPSRLFVHAGAVGWRGRAIIIPAVSRAGKSELVMALVNAGATYYSDEYAVLDDDGLVHPYARPLALRNADGMSKRRVEVGELGHSVGTVPLPVGAVVATRFVQGASWHPRSVSRADAVLALIANTVRARTDPPVALRRLSRAVQDAAAFESSRGEAAQAATAILETCSRITPSINHLRRGNASTGAPGQPRHRGNVG